MEGLFHVDIVVGSVRPLSLSTASKKCSCGALHLFCVFVGCPRILLFWFTVFALSVGGHEWRKVIKDRPVYDLIEEEIRDSNCVLCYHVLNN